MPTPCSPMIRWARPPVSYTCGQGANCGPAVGQLNLDSEIILDVHPVPLSAGDVDFQSYAGPVGGLHA